MNAAASSPQLDLAVISTTVLDRLITAADDGAKMLGYLAGRMDYPNSTDAEHGAMLSARREAELLRAAARAAKDEVVSAALDELAAQAQALNMGY